MTLLVKNSDNQKSRILCCAIRQLRDRRGQFSFSWQIKDFFVVHFCQENLNFRQRSEFLFEDGDRAEGGVGVPVAVDPLPDQVLVFPDVSSVVWLVAVSVVTVWTPGKKFNRITSLDWRCEMIIFESLLTTFEVSVILWGRWGSR